MVGGRCYANGSYPEFNPQHDGVIPPEHRCVTRGRRVVIVFARSDNNYRLFIDDRPPSTDRAIERDFERFGHGRPFPNRLEASNSTRTRGYRFSGAYPRGGGRRGATEAVGPLFFRRQLFFSIFSADKIKRNIFAIKKQQLFFDRYNIENFDRL